MYKYTSPYTGSDEENLPVDSDMLLSLMSLAPGTPRPSELDFFLSLLHHFQSGWALKWASLTWNKRQETHLHEILFWFNKTHQTFLCFLKTHEGSFRSTRKHNFRNKSKFGQKQELEKKEVYAPTNLSGSQGFDVRIIDSVTELDRVGVMSPIENH